MFFYVLDKQREKDVDMSARMSSSFKIFQLI